MGRFLRACWYYVSGRFIWGAKALEKDPHVIEARYDHAKDKLLRDLEHAKNALGSVVALKEKAKLDLERLGAQKAEHEETMQGAEALSADVMAKLRRAGKTDVEIQADPEFMQYSAAYADAESSLAGVATAIDRVKADIEHLHKLGQERLLQLQQQQRLIQEVERKKHVTIMDVTMANSIKALEDVASGFATSGVAKELADLEQIGLKARADAEVSRALSGSDASLQAAKLRAAAHAARAQNRLVAKLGLGAKTAEAPAAAAPAKAEAVGAGTGGKPSGGLPG